MNRICYGKVPIAILDAHIQIKCVSDDGNTSIIAFNRVGNLIVIKARVDSTDGNFILDTGAPHLVLNLTYFRHYTSTTVPDAEQTSISGATSPLITTSIKELSIGTINYSRLDADLVSLGNIENAKGIKVLGLLGVDLFKQCEMIIDFENSLIYLHRISRKESVNYKHALLNDVSLYNSFPFDLVENRIMVTTEMGGKKLKLIIDCAAEANILDSRLPDHVFSDFTIQGKVKLVGPGNRKIDAVFGSLGNMKLGGKDIGNMLVTVTNLEKTCFSYSGCVDGVLGFNFLSMHKIGFNFVKRQMYIWK